jgi:hypothetical protein
VGVIKIATRFLSRLALLAAMLWVTLPAVIVAAAAPTQIEGDACPCCEGKAALGAILACAACQAGIAGEGTLAAPQTFISAAWLIGPATTGTGVEPSPAEPPPR